MEKKSSYSIPDFYYNLGFNHFPLKKGRSHFFLNWANIVFYEKKRIFSKQRSTFWFPKLFPPFLLKGRPFFEEKKSWGEWNGVFFDVSLFVYQTFLFFFSSQYFSMIFWSLSRQNFRVYLFFFDHQKNGNWMEPKLNWEEKNVMIYFTKMKTSAWIFSLRIANCDLKSGFLLRRRREVL